MPLIHAPEMAEFGPDKFQKVNLFENPRFFCDLYCLLPGQEQKPHTHDANDKIYYVLTGDVTFRDAEEDITGKPGDAMWAKAGVSHGVKNTGLTEATLLVFMAPHPRGESMKL